MTVFWRNNVYCPIQKPAHCLESGKSPYSMYPARLAPQRPDREGQHSPFIGRQNFRCRSSKSIKSIEKYAFRVSDLLSQYGLESESLDSGGSLLMEHYSQALFVFQACKGDRAKSLDRVNTISPPRPPLRNSQRDSLQGYFEHRSLLARP